MARPNYFLGIKLNTAEFQEKTSLIQAAILERKPILNKCMTPAKKLHITNFVMTLQADQVARAAQVLGECQSVVDELFYERSLSLQFSALGSFRKNVLFTHPEQSATLDTLHSLTQRLQEKFKEQNLVLEVSNDWKPHVTIAKTSADRKNGRKLQIIKEDYEGFDQLLDNIEVPLTTIDLLSMAEMDDSGYYKSYGSVMFRSQLERMELC